MLGTKFHTHTTQQANCVCVCCVVTEVRQWTVPVYCSTFCHTENTKTETMRHASYSGVTHRLHCFNPRPLQVHFILRHVTIILTVTHIPRSWTAVSWSFCSEYYWNKACLASTFRMIFYKMSFDKFEEKLDGWIPMDTGGYGLDWWREVLSCYRCVVGVVVFSAAGECRSIFGSQRFETTQRFYLKGY